MPNKEKAPILKIDLSNYPNILKSLSRDGTLGTAQLREWLMLLDTALEKGYDQVSDREFGLSLVNLVKATIDAHFDYHGIVVNANNEQEADMLAVLKWENNPLSFITGGKRPVDVNGNEVPLREFLGVSKIDVKSYLQRLLYGARYMDAATLVNHMSLGKYDLMQVEKNKYIDQLIQIQPALNYQKSHDLIVGQFKEGTGFFNCGTVNLNDYNACPACTIAKDWKVSGDEAYCLNCRAYFSHKMP